jgi:hypothetical protein
MNRTTVNSGKPSTRNIEEMAIEILFNSVEVELARRWAHGEVPASFASRPVGHLRKMVKVWWEIYHESVAAATNQNRKVRERNQAYSAEALDTPGLVNALKVIHENMNLKALNAFRPLHEAEHLAIGILHIISTYYTKLTN